MGDAVSGPMRWSQDEAMRRALVVGITAIRGYCDPYDPDCIMGALAQAGYCVIREPEPLGPPRPSARSSQ